MKTLDFAAVRRIYRSADRAMKARKGLPMDKIITQRLRPIVRDYDKAKKQMDTFVWYRLPPDEQLALRALVSFAERRGVEVYLQILQESRA